MGGIIEKKTRGAAREKKRLKKKRREAKDVEAEKRRRRRSSGGEPSSRFFVRGGSAGWLASFLIDGPGLFFLTPARALYAKGRPQTAGYLKLIPQQAARSLAS